MIIQKIKRAIKILRGINEINITALKKVGLTIGENCHIQDGVVIDFNHCQHIFIGNNVTLAPHVYILAHDASTFNLLGYTKIGKVVIMDNVFIGARAVILPGTQIEENCIIGAGSVVKGKLLANHVYVGNPARMICSIEDYLKKQEAIFIASPKFDEKYTLRNKIPAIERMNLNKEMNSLIDNGWGFIK